MKHTNVYVTGMGLVTSLGIGKEENWEALCAGRSGVRPIEGFDTSTFPVRIAAQVHESFTDHLVEAFTNKVRRRMAPFSHLTLLSAHLALEDAGLGTDWDDPGRVAICLGTGAGGLSYVESQISGRGKGDLAHAVHRLESLAVLKFMPNAPCAVLSIEYGIEGPVSTVSSSCASGAVAIANGCDWIRSGRADVVFAGGVDVNVYPMCLKGFCNLQALSERNDEPERASRPFDAERDGFVIGDGAAMLVLES